MPEPVAVVGDQDRSAGGVFITTRPPPAQIEPLTVGTEGIGERVDDRPQFRVAVALPLDRLRVEPERDVVDEHPPVDLGEVDAALTTIDEGVEGAHDVIAIDAQVEGEVVAGACRDAARRADRARRRSAATIACDPSPPAIASPSAPSATAPRTSCSRSLPSVSSIGRMPRARASSARLNLSALPPPDFGLKKRTGCSGGSALARGTWTLKAARVAASHSASPARMTSAWTTWSPSAISTTTSRRERHNCDRDPQDPGRPGAKQAVPGGGERDGDCRKDDQAARELLDHDVDGENEDQGRQHESRECGYPLRRPVLSHEVTVTARSTAARDPVQTWRSSSDAIPAR